jgi:hypothetical protein
LKSGEGGCGKSLFLRRDVGDSVASSKTLSPEALRSFIVRSPRGAQKFIYLVDNALAQLIAISVGGSLLAYVTYGGSHICNCVLIEFARAYLLVVFDSKTSSPILREPSACASEE